MKTTFLAMIMVTLILPATAQTLPTDKKVPATQTVLNALVTNPNIIVITGKLTDAATSKAITDAKINLSKVSEGVISAAVDKDGNYALAINKDLIGKYTTLSFKIDGYNDLKIRRIKANRDLQTVDVRLMPEENKEPVNVKYVLSEDPYNTLVIKF